MFIQTEQTPNPQTLKFLPGKVVMDLGTAFFESYEASPKKTRRGALFSGYLARGWVDQFDTNGHREDSD